MKTSMAYRLYRLYFNSNSHNHQLFGNRVYSPLNAQASVKKDQLIAGLVRVLMILATVGAISAIAAL